MHTHRRIYAVILADCINTKTSYGISKPSGMRFHCV